MIEFQLAGGGYGTFGDDTEQQRLRRLRRPRASASGTSSSWSRIIVLGGGLSRIGRLYVNVPALWVAHVFAAGAGAAPRTRLVPSLHGDASGVRGAARLWREPPTSAGTGARSCG